MTGASSGLLDRSSIRPRTRMHHLHDHRAGRATHELHVLHVVASRRLKDLLGRVTGVGSHHSQRSEAGLDGRSLSVAASFDEEQDMTTPADAGPVPCTTYSKPCLTKPFSVTSMLIVGTLTLKIIGHIGCSCRFFPTPGTSATTSTPCPSRCFRGPIPDSMSSFGDDSVPALTITSRAARSITRLPLRSYSTPTACVPSKTMRRTKHRVRTVRFRRNRARPRYALASLAKSSALRHLAHPDAVLRLPVVVGIPGVARLPRSFDERVVSSWLTPCSVTCCGPSPPRYWLAPPLYRSAFLKKGNTLRSPSRRSRAWPIRRSRPRFLVPRPCR